MMATLHNREEVEAQYKWDIESMYSSLEGWEKEFKDLEERMDAVEAYKGKILESEKTLLEMVDLLLKNERQLTNLYTFAKMKLDEDTNNNTFQSMTMRAEFLGVNLSAKASFVVPEILAGDEGLLRNYLKSEDLKIYTRYFEEILREKPHVLNESEEKLLAEAGEILGGAQQAFGMLNNADLTFPIIKDENGNDLQLSHGSFIPTMESKNRGVRKEAFEKFYEVYGNHKNVMASLISSNVKGHTFNAKVRHYDSARQAALSQNNVPETVYDQLIEAVHEHLPAMHKYMAIRKKALKLEELHMYDLYVPIVADVDINVAYEEAKEMTLKALKPLGESYIDVVKSAFDEGWIDVYENKGKRSGAYSWGTYDSKPFILLNYHDTLDNAFTLVHEMGHSMHSYLTRKNQPFVYGEYSIFVAEVASTTNEALLNQYLLKNVEDPKEKLFILNHYLEQFRTTVYRQTMFAEFERDIHAIVESGGALTAEVLSNHYRDLNVKYYGPEMVVDDEIALEWARIPHFYYDFYVYQYATGFSAAIALSNKILNEGQPAVDKYLEFLSSGSSDEPIKVLQRAGADMLTKEPVANALAIFSDLVDEMEKLMEV